MARREHLPDPISETTSVLFSISELQLLQSVIRHEFQNQETWRYPPASLELNDQVAASLLFCAEFKQLEAPLTLSYGDCLVIDFTVPQTAKDLNGLPIGYSVLLKSFAARRVLRSSIPLPTSDADAAEPTLPEIRARLQKFADSSNTTVLTDSADESASL